MSSDHEVKKMQQLILNVIMGYHRHVGQNPRFRKSLRAGDKAHLFPCCLFTPPITKGGFWFPSSGVANTAVCSRVRTVIMPGHSWSAQAGDARVEFLKTYHLNFQLAMKSELEKHWPSLKGVLPSDKYSVIKFLM